jgi:hypothetical protein
MKKLFLMLASVATVLFPPTANAGDPDKSTVEVVAKATGNVEDGAKKITPKMFARGSIEPVVDARPNEVEVVVVRFLGLGNGRVNGETAAALLDLADYRLARLEEVLSVSQKLVLDKRLVIYGSWLQVDYRNLGLQLQWPETGNAPADRPEPKVLLFSQSYSWFAKDLLVAAVKK